MKLFKYYRRNLADLMRDGRPAIPEHDPLLKALVREHGVAGRPDLAPELRGRPRWVRELRTIAIAFLTVLIAGAAHAETALPYPKGREQCASGYTQSGSYCTPKTGGTVRPAVSRVGSCPSGWVADGLAVFERLRGRRHDASVFLYAFDLIELDGQDLRREPLQVRKTSKGAQKAAGDLNRPTSPPALGRGRFSASQAAPRLPSSLSPSPSHTRALPF